METSYIYSSLDKDLDQWVFQPLLFNLMSILLHIKKYKIAENAKPCKKTHYLLNIFKKKIACIKYMLRL